MVKYNAYQQRSLQTFLCKDQIVLGQIHHGSQHRGPEQCQRFTDPHQLVSSHSEIASKLNLTLTLFLRYLSLFLAYFCLT